MAAKYQLSKFFAKGAGHVIRYPNCYILWFSWHGSRDGCARYVPHVNRYTRNGVEHKTLAALLRSVETEHGLNDQGGH